MSPIPALSSSISLPLYEVYALRYATVERQGNDNFIARDIHDGPMPMDYFVWVIRGEQRTILVDTGFNREAANQRKRTFLRCPIASLNSLGIAADDITDLILTHLHYDHAGNVRLVPNAKIHLQESEMQFATGKYMRYDMMRHSYTVDDVVDIVRGVYDKRVVFYQGDAEFAPGIQLLHIGGHTQGLQAVRVHTQRGWIVLASDASHFYENMHKEAPFPIVLHIGEMLLGYDKLVRFADSENHIIPGHDPLVMQRYPRYLEPQYDIVSLHDDPAI
jgi:glyoxylase-like metal-dependent hydrolase (beta-lactamase superfamily II)